MKHVVMEDRMQLNMTYKQYKILFSQKKKIEELFQVKVNREGLDLMTSVIGKSCKAAKIGESGTRSTFSSPEKAKQFGVENFTLSICGNAENQKQAEAYVLALMRPEIVHIFAYQKELQIIFGNKLWIECLELTFGVCINDDGTDYVLAVSGTEHFVTLAVMCMQELSELYDSSKDTCITIDNRLQQLDTQLINSVRIYKHTELPIHRYSLLPFAVKEMLLSWLYKAYKSALKEENSGCSELSGSIASDHGDKSMEMSGADLSVIVIESDPEDEQLALDKSVLVLETPERSFVHGQSSLNSDPKRSLHLAKNSSKVFNHSKAESMPSVCTSQISNRFHKKTDLTVPSSPDIEIVDVVHKGSLGQPSENRCKAPVSSSDNQHTSQHPAHNMSTCPPQQWTDVHSHMPTGSNRNLRPIVIDGSNVAMCHGKPIGVFSCRGIALCIEYFIKRGHTSVTAFVPQYRRCTCYGVPVTDKHLLEELALKQLVVFTPSRRLGNKRISSYDDRFIVDLAFKNNGVIVSNDNFRDVMAENEDWRRTVESRLLMYCFVGDIFMVPFDPLGRYGPHLDEFLALPS